MNPFEPINRFDEHHLLLTVNCFLCKGIILACSNSFFIPHWYILIFGRRRLMIPSLASVVVREVRVKILFQWRHCEICTPLIKCDDANLHAC